MFNEERQNYILDKLNSNNRVSVAQLSTELDVSEVTIRKDLSFLEEKHLLKRTYGGAISIEPHVLDQAIEEKSEKNIALKSQIVDRASTFLTDGLNIFLDAGTTIQALIPKLYSLTDISVITYDLEIAYKLSKYENINLYILGGYVDHKTRTSLSLAGFEDLCNVHADISFIGTDAFDENYVYSTNENKAKVKNRMIVNSSQSILLTDSSKFQKKGLYSFYTCQDFDYIITDSNNKKLNDYISSANLVNFIQ